MAAGKPARYKTAVSNPPTSKGGAKLKEIGTGARRKIESLLGTRVYLELHVIVEANWRESKSFVESLDWRNQLERLGVDQITETNSGEE